MTDDGGIDPGSGSYFVCFLYSTLPSSYPQQFSMIKTERDNACTASKYHNNPLERFPMSLDPSSDAFRLDVHSVVCEVVSGWGEVLPSDIIITRIMGGNTNSLYKVEARSLSDAVVLRLFGRGTELFIDRSTENSALSQLSKLGMAPTFHGLIENGRVEGFLSGRHLNPSELALPKVLSAVATQMAILHGQQIKLEPAPPTIHAKMRELLQILKGNTMCN